MDELIRKQDALDVTMETVFVEYEDTDPRKEESIILQTKAAIRDRIKALLPVYVPVINVGDMISRQAAIEIVDFECGEWRGLAKTIEKRLSSLPSAHPEQRCVNCGRTANNGGWYEDGRTRCPIEEHYALPKDGYCHLWEKRKDWEDDYVKRPEEGEK